MFSEISKSLFGTAEDSEVKVIEEILRNNRERGGRIIHVVEKMTTIVNKTRGYQATNRKHIESLEFFMKIFTRRMQSFERFSLRGANMTRGLLMIDILQNDLNVMQVEYNNFEKHLDLFEQQKEALHAGHLTENTLPITKLQDILDSARGSSYSHVDLEWYY